jgi:hypothetical protein
LLKGLGPAFLSLYFALTTTVIGRPAQGLSARWLDGNTLAEIAANLFKAVPKQTAKRIVAQALHNRSWAQDIKGARTVEVILEYLHIWDIVDGVILQPETPDK